MCKDCNICPDWDDAGGCCGKGSGWSSTTTAPTVPGWYWIKSLALNGMVEVFTRPGHDYLCILNPMCCQHTKRDFLEVGRLTGAAGDCTWASRDGGLTPHRIEQPDL